MNILETIKLHENEFSKTELKVYSYIMQYPENIETYTITQIAAICQVSTSAVLRFCQVLGFKGYKDFRFEMIRYLREFYEGKPIFDVWEQLTNDYFKTVSQYKQINRDTIDRLVHSLKHKAPVYAIGIHYSSLPARHLTLGLQDLNIMSFGAYDYVEAGHLYNHIRDDATFILFSISGAKTNIKRFLVDLEDKMPQSSYLVTLNPNAKLINDFPNSIVLPGYELTNKSIINTESLFMCFVEIILNLLHNDL